MVFIEKIRSLYRLSPDTEKLLMEKVLRLDVPKKTLLVKEGEKYGYAYFIEKGMTRSFWLVGGEEITTSFSCEGDIVFSMDELYYDKTSEEYVETLEDTIAYRISIKDLLDLFHTNIELANWQGSSIRTNTAGCIRPTRSVLHFRPKTGTRHSDGSFLMSARESG